MASFQPAQPHSECEPTIVSRYQCFINAKATYQLFFPIGHLGIVKFLVNVQHPSWQLIFTYYRGGKTGPANPEIF